MLRAASSAAAAPLPSSPAAGAWLLLALGLAALAALAVGLLLRRWLRERLRRLRPRRRRLAPRHPVVLAHGLFGFDEIRVAGARHEYFRGVPEILEREGVTVHRPRVAMAGGVASRAADLAAFVRELPARRVNVIAHSMGGLDARFGIARLGLDRRVASVVTIGTPHHGTPLADLTASLGERARIFSALERMGLDVAAFRDLTTEGMRGFNQEIRDARGVAYASVVGVAPRRGEVHPLLLASHLWLASRSGESDGVVPADSQRWGEVLRTVEADHWAQIGWSRHFDAAQLYLELLRELRGRGL